MSGRLDYHGSCTCPSRWPTYVTVCLRTPAANLGRLFRPDNPKPLMLNWKHLPMVITAGRSRSWSRAPTSSPPSGSGRAHRRRRRCSGRGPGSTSKTSSVSWSTSETAWGEAITVGKPAGISSARCSSTTGPPATSKPGSMSRSAPTWASPSPPTSRPTDAGAVAAAGGTGAHAGTPRPLPGYPPRCSPTSALTAPDPHRRSLRLRNHFRAREGDPRGLHRLDLGWTSAGTVAAGHPRTFLENGYEVVLRAKRPRVRKEARSGSTRLAAGSSPPRRLQTGSPVAWKWRGQFHAADKFVGANGRAVPTGFTDHADGGARRSASRPVLQSQLAQPG